MLRHRRSSGFSALRSEKKSERLRRGVYRIDQLEIVFLCKYDVGTNSSKKVTKDALVQRMFRCVQQIVISIRNTLAHLTGFEHAREAISARSSSSPTSCSYPACRLCKAELAFLDGRVQSSRVVYADMDGQVYLVDIFSLVLEEIGKLGRGFFRALRT